MILRHAAEDDAEALHFFDVGDTSIPWLAEVAEIVAGLLGWRADPAATDEDRQVVIAERDGELVAVAAHVRLVGADGRSMPDRRERRNARRELPAAERDVTAAEHHLDDVTQQGRPVLDQRAQLRSERSDLVRDVRDFRVWRRQINNYYPTSELAEARHDALVTWKHWADGHTIAADRLATAADTLNASDRPELRVLAVPLSGWLTERGLEPRPHRRDVAMRSAGPELGIEF